MSLQHRVNIHDGNQPKLREQNPGDAQRGARLEEFALDRYPFATRVRYDCASASNSERSSRAIFEKFAGLRNTDDHLLRDKAARSRILMKRFALVCGALIVVTIVCAVSAGWLLAHPVQTPIRNPPADLNAQPVTFESDSGANVHGWWCPIQNARGTVLLLPGIRANRLSMVDRARFLHRAGYSVLLIDFQATGETKGDHITFGWKESRDVLAAIHFVRQIDPTDRVAIVGSSLGGVAALLATPPLKVDALVLEEVYPTIEIATRNRMENYLGGVGRILTPVLLNQLQWRLGIAASQLRPLDHIANVECPVLIISGEKDRNTRPSDTRMLVERARSPKQVWFVPNAGHVDLHRAAREEYETRVLAFLAQMSKTP